MKRLLLGTLLMVGLASLSRAGAAAITLPHMLPGDDALSGDAADQTTPAIATGGNMMLAAWSDKRAYPVGANYYEYETAHDIYGIRLDAAGAPIDAVPFVITQEPASQDNPQIVWNGTNWLVVFESYDVSGTGYYEKSLEAVRVSPAGLVLDAAPIKIRGVSPSGLAWAAASDGTDWALVFQASSSSSALVSLRITAAGVVQQPPKTIVPSTYFSRYNLRLAYAAGLYLFTWSEFSDTLALRFDSNLNVLDAAPTTLLTGYGLSTLASSGGQFFMTWVDQQPPLYIITARGSRVSTAGVKLDGAGLAISGNNPPQAYTTTSVVWDGTYWRVTWGFNNAVSVARVTTAGAVLDPGGVSVSGPMTGPSAALPGGGVELTWSNFSNTFYDVFSAAIPPGNIASPNQAIASSAPMQILSDTAIGATGAMMIWHSDTAAAGRIMVQPLDLAGNPTTGAPVVLDTAVTNTGLGAPAIAWNGSMYLATWSGPSGVVAQRLLQNGTLVDPAPIVVLNPGFGPADVEAMGGDFLVVGLRCGITCQYINPIASRVRGSDGFVLDPSQIPMGVNFGSNPRVTLLGGRWLVAWQDNATHDNPSAYTMGTFIDSAGAKVPEFNIHGPYSTAGGNGIFSLGLASSGSVALVLQSQELTSGVENDLLGRLVDPVGNVQPSFNLTPWIGNQYRPNAAWDGTQFVVTYMDQKNRFAPSLLETLDARGDMFGMRISSSGAILDPQGFAISLSPAGEAHPGVAGSGGVSWISGSIVLNQAPFANYRIGYDLYGTGGNQWPVAVASGSTGGGDVPLSVNFSSTGSTDPDGSVASTLWDFGDGSTSTLANPAHTFMIPGNYVVTATVTDNKGAKSVNTVPLGVTAPNMIPVAVALATPPAGAAPLSVVFTADGSYDPDGAIGNYLWTFSDGTMYYGSTAYDTFPTPGTYTATLQVFDARGGIGTTTISVIAQNPNNVPPLAPTNLHLGSVFATQADLFWTDNSSNETGFIPERCTGTAVFCNANPAMFVALSATGANVTSVVSAGLTAGTTYAWRVKAVNAVGSSAYTNTVEATTPIPPPPPTNLVATPKLQGTKVQVKLTWKDNATTETGYTVQRCTGSTCTNFVSIAFLPTNYVSFKDQSVQRAKTYRYRVYAESNAGPSGFSNIAKVTTP